MNSTFKASGRSLNAFFFSAPQMAHSTAIQVTKPIERILSKKFNPSIKMQFSTAVIASVVAVAAVQASPTVSDDVQKRADYGPNGLWICSLVK